MRIALIDREMHVLVPELVAQAIGEQQSMPRGVAMAIVDEDARRRRRITSRFRRWCRGLDLRLQGLRALALPAQRSQSGVAREIEDAAVGHTHEQHRRSPLDVVAALGKHGKACGREAGVNRGPVRQWAIEAVGEHDRRLVTYLEL